MSQFLPLRRATPIGICCLLNYLLQMLPMYVCIYIFILTLTAFVCGKEGIKEEENIKNYSSDWL